jgi:hypothetical protein
MTNHHERSEMMTTATHHTILIHRGGYGPQHRLGEIEVRPEGADCHGYERFYVRLSILGDSNRASASVVAESLDRMIADFTATAMLKETYIEAGARRKREHEKASARRRHRKACRRW